MPVFSSVGYCPCGEEIYIEYLPKSLDWRWRFSDARGYEISHCPACGRLIVEDDLLSR